MHDVYKKIDNMGDECENQYLLALAIAKRVRKLRSGAPPMSSGGDPKRDPFSVAMKEIVDGTIQYSMNNEN